MHAIDTNVLVRLLTGEDERQAAAAETFVRKTSGGWISHLVLAETMWVLDSVYARSRAQRVTAIETLLDHSLLSIQDIDVVRAALSQFKRHSTVGFSDCLVLETARAAGNLPLGTFDRRLGSLDGTKRL